MSSAVSEREGDMTTGGSFETQLPTMEQASQHVYDVNQQIQSQLSNLRSRLQPLAGSWQGQAATSFHQLMERWDNDARTLNQALQSIGDGLKQSHQTYQAQEATNAQDISRISTNLGS
jgi:ESAT-6 family protein